VLARQILTAWRISFATRHYWARLFSTRSITGDNRCAVRLGAYCRARAPGCASGGCGAPGNRKLGGHRTGASSCAQNA